MVPSFTFSAGKYITHSAGMNITALRAITRFAETDITGAVKNESFLQLLFRGVKKKRQNKQTERKTKQALFFGYPKAYKGTPRGEVCL